MMTELLPCPFCGEAAEIERCGDHKASTIYACTMCGCRLETGEEWGHGRKWNDRAIVTTDPVLTSNLSEFLNDYTDMLIEKEGVSSVSVRLRECAKALQHRAAPSAEQKVGDVWSTVLALRNCIHLYPGIKKDAEKAIELLRDMDARLAALPAPPTASEQ